MGKYFVCAADEVKEGRGKKVIVEGEEIVLFTVEGQVCAISNMCPHQKFQRLHEGEFKDGIVTCPMHGWAYDVRTGFSTNASGKLKTFRTEIMNGKIVLSIDEV
ncbi:MAG: Rieske (2Fe-2S) protein [Bacteroidota bacterium]|jgi:nitrite reductase/ring-hydroxylating ferredoxin subunit